MVTYYVVQSFQRGNRGFLIPDEPRQAMSEGHARLLAFRLLEGRAGVIAFSRTGDPNTGEWGDAEIICHLGDCPEAEWEMAG